MCGRAAGGLASCRRRLFPELVYAMFLNVVYVKGVLDITLGSQARWKHVVAGDDRRKVRVSES